MEKSSEYIPRLVKEGNDVELDSQYHEAPNYYPGASVKVTYEDPRTSEGQSSSGLPTNGLDARPSPQQHNPTLFPKRR